MGSLTTDSPHTTHCTTHHTTTMRAATACLALLLTITVLSIQAQDNKAAKVSQLRAARETDADPEAKRNRSDGKKKKGRRPKPAGRGKGQRKAAEKGRMQGRGIVVKGNDCEYITLKDITGNSGCSSGQKFVLKGSSGVRRQFLIVSDNVILAFITKKKKFTECTAFTDITTSVTYKSIAGLDSVGLSVTAASNSSATDSAATTAAGAAATTAAGAAAASGETTAAAAPTTAAAGATTAAGAAGATTAGAAATTAAGVGATTAPGTNSTSARQSFPLSTSPASSYSKFTKVFGVGVFGHSSISDAKFQHVASVLAEWLDNDEDGCVDNPTVLTALLAKHNGDQTAIVSPGTSGARHNNHTSSWTGTLQHELGEAGYSSSAPIFNEELLPNCADPAATASCADASLEEIWHTITSHGY